MITSEVPERRVRRRLGGGGNPLDNSVVQSSEQSTEDLDIGNLPSDSTSISGGLDSYNNISESFAGHHGSSSVSVLNYDNDSEDAALPNPEVYTGTVSNDQVAVNTVNEGESLVNGDSSADAGNHDADSSSHTSSEEADPLERIKKYVDEVKASEYYIPVAVPDMTMSHLVACLSIEDLTTIAYNGWSLGNLTEEEVRSHIEGLIRKEEAGIPEDTISSRLKTRVYTPSANGLGTKGSTSSSDKQEKCGICMEKYKMNDSIADLYYCEHDFHADCIKDRLLETNTCPMCRSLAIIPDHFFDWKGDDPRMHRGYFKRC
ncbi:E3 ubiquitin ligase BIG BROTHER-related-like [Coffea eugenioides]|uniref:E3 ubiquitin ligase BIG BROTHER-related-like n=1 Tax=Coffea eugenioides TaxID=49369 RepID=UPI000F60891E|nr:E3 ubiquitin ligase BIG BROTHER-related-like [Coffea eugenioides]